MLYSVLAEHDAHTVRDTENYGKIKQMQIWAFHPKFTNT